MWMKRNANGSSEAADRRATLRSSLSKVAVAICTVLAFGLCAAGSQPVASSQSSPPPAPGGGGGLYGDPQNPLGSSNDNLDKHHLPSSESYKSSKNPSRNRKCGPAILMHPDDHMQTASNDFGQNAAKKASAKAYREAQAALMAQGDIAGAMQMDINDIKSLQAAGKLRYNYDAAIEDAKSTLTNGRLDDCNRRYPSGGSLPESGTTNAPQMAVSGDIVSVSATGGGLTPGKGYNAIMADSQQLAQNPSWQASGRALNPGPLVANSSGNIPAQNLALGGTFYWEPGGEQDSSPAAVGSAKIGFVSIDGGDATHAAVVILEGC